MKRTSIFIVFLILMTSCNRFSNDFFEFLFNSKGISLDRDCSNTPSIFSEGRSFEIYSMSGVNTDLIKQKILNKSLFVKSEKYDRYKIPEWHKTPINRLDSVYSFIHSEMRDEKNTCFDENKLIELLQQRKNYYTFLYDNLGREKLFIWDTKNQKLYLLTTYEL